jgi:nucleotide-binding universal stress UspA family protein
MSSENSQVVVGYDFSNSGRAALYRALALATRAPFHVLHFACIIDPHHAVPGFPTHHIDIDYATKIQGELSSLIEQELKARKVTGRVHFFVHARIGKAVEEILSVARDVGADLIIVGSKGLTGVERLVLGSVSEHVVREAHCTVEVARPKGYEYVPLTEMFEVPEHGHGHYVAPHRYSYEDNRMTTRPPDWPLY